MTTRQAAEAILAWYRARQPAELRADLNDPRASADLLAAVDVVAAAALDPDPERASAGLRTLFGQIIEALNDRLEAPGRTLSDRIMLRVIWQAAQRDPRLSQALATHGITHQAELIARHAALVSGQAWKPPAAPRRIAVLSRVTLGADILLTSIMLQHARQRWPEAQVLLVGAAKLTALFGGRDGCTVLAVDYPRRGGLGPRLEAWLTTAQRLAEHDVDLVLNPDSRLDQLGLLPLAPLSASALWRGLLPADRPPGSLAALLDDWCRARLNPQATPCLPRLWPDATTRHQSDILARRLGPGPWLACKFDHGGNPAKALPQAAEVAILQAARQRGWRILLDRGFGAEEEAASDALLAASGATAWDLAESDLDQSADGPPPEALVRLSGSIGFWAAALRCSRLALSYDSVGHHLAAALGVPVIIAFTGHPHDAFAAAWRSCGPAAITQIVIPNDARAQPEQWQRVIEAITDMEAGG